MAHYIGSQATFLQDFLKILELFVRISKLRKCFLCNTCIVIYVATVKQSGAIYEFIHEEGFENQINITYP